MSEWKPIADAPKGGDDLLLAWDGKAVRIVFRDLNNQWRITRSHQPQMKPTHFLSIPEPPK